MPFLPAFSVAFLPPAYALRQKIQRDCIFRRNIVEYLRCQPEACFRLTLYFVVKLVTRLS